MPDQSTSLLPLCGIYRCSSLFTGTTFSHKSYRDRSKLCIELQLTLCSSAVGRLGLLLAESRTRLHRSVRTRRLSGSSLRKVVLRKRTPADWTRLEGTWCNRVDYRTFASDFDLVPSLDRQARLFPRPLPHFRSNLRLGASCYSLGCWTALPSVGNCRLGVLGHHGHRLYQALPRAVLHVSLIL